MLRSSCGTFSHGILALKYARVKCVRPTRLYHRASDKTPKSEVRRMNERIYGDSGVVQSPQESVVSRVQRTIISHFGPQYRVAVFGSSVYSTKQTGDLDLMILDDQRPNGITPQLLGKRLPRVYSVFALSKALSYDGFRIQAVQASAPIPIVAFEDPRTKLSCDICVNERVGYVNSQMIKKYVELSPILEPIIRDVKMWASSIGIAGAAMSGFSTYCLALMTIALFQKWGLLPNLQEEPLPPAMKDDFFWVTDRKRTRTQQCDVRFHRHIPSSWQSSSKPHMTKEEALEKWMQFWAEEYQYGVDAVCIRLGGIVSASTAFPSSNPVSHGGNPARSDSIIIADPFVVNKDKGYPIGFAMLKKFRAGSRLALERLT
ncbi:hypothetical protein BDW22DRAFT_1483833 [Trametopsis cervina]|nr:hypothetical protein BDW22DRAFT_1483833 [Trametopsis cervina]